MSGGIGAILGGVAVFIFCSIIQATLGDSSMFSTSYMDKGFVQGLIVQVTFWPGWLVTGALVLSGINQMREDEASDEAKTPSPETD